MYALYNLFNGGCIDHTDGSPTELVAQAYRRAGFRPKAANVRYYVRKLEKAPVGSKVSITKTNYYVAVEED